MLKFDYKMGSVLLCFFLITGSPETRAANETEMELTVTNPAILPQPPFMDDNLDALVPFNPMHEGGGQRSPTLTLLGFRTSGALDEFIYAPFTQDLLQQQGLVFAEVKDEISKLNSSVPRQSYGQSISPLRSSILTPEAELAWKTIFILGKSSMSAKIRFKNHLKIRVNEFFTGSEENEPRHFHYFCVNGVRLLITAKIQDLGWTDERSAKNDLLKALRGVEHKILDVELFNEKKTLHKVIFDSVEQKKFELNCKNGSFFN